jgi:hypothetical protein
MARTRIHTVQHSLKKYTHSGTTMVPWYEYHGMCAYVHVCVRTRVPWYVHVYVHVYHGTSGTWLLHVYHWYVLRLSACVSNRFRVRTRVWPYHGTSSINNVMVLNTMVRTYTRVRTYVPRGTYVRTYGTVPWYVRMLCHNFLTGTHVH